MIKKSNQKGFSTVEAMLAAAVFVLLAGFLSTTIIFGKESTALAGSRARATLIADEGNEAVRNIRDASFSNLSDGTYGLAISSNQWVFSGSSDTADGFTREVVISTVDSRTKSVTVNVTWQQTLQRTGLVSTVSYFTNWLGTAPWSAPTRQTGLDLTGTADGIKIAVSGNYAYVVRNVSGSANFYIVNVSNPASPSVSGSMTLSGAPSNIFVSGSYAYVSSNADSQEMQIVSISNPASPSLTGSYNAGGSEDANGIYVVGTTAYLTRNACNGGIFGCSSDWFITINVTTPASPAKLDSLTSGSGLLGLGGDEDLKEVVVIGNYAYIGTTNSGGELFVVNVTNASSISGTTSYNVSGSTSGVSITGYTNTVLLGGANGTLYIINVTTPGSPSTLGSLAVGGSVNDISLGNSNTYAFLATADSTKEFQVINIANTASPVLLGSVNHTATLNGIAYDTTLDRAFGVSGQDSEELTVFQP